MIRAKKLRLPEERGTESPRHISEILAELMPKYSTTPLVRVAASPKLASFRRSPVSVKSRDFAGVQFNG